jgi:hypothetical protein
MNLLKYIAASLYCKDQMGTIKKQINTGKYHPFSTIPC